MKRKPTSAKSPVSARALLQRIQRVLQKRDELIRTTRGGRAEIELGEYYIVDVQRDAIVTKDVDIEALGRELEVLKPWEELRK